MGNGAFMRVCTLVVIRSEILFAASSLFLPINITFWKLSHW